MKIDKFAGLQIVFNMSGKNPYNHDIGKCLIELFRMRVLNTLSSLMIAVGILTALVSGLVMFVGFTPTNIISLFAGFVCGAVGFKIARTEYGKNIISVADEWNRVISKLKKVGINLSGAEHGNKVASVFEARLVEIVSAKLEAEKDGCERKVEKLERLFKQTRGLAEELKLKVSDREEFFKGVGCVEFETRINLQAA